MNQYEKQAKKFLEKHGLTLTLAHKGDRCPPWTPKPCKHVHGDRYRVTLRRKSGEALSFDFWGSLTEKEKGLHPTEYNVLAALGADASAPTDPDEVYEEYGDLKPSQAQAIARFARRLQTFFSDKELEALMEIQ